MISISLYYLDVPFEQILCNFNKIQLNKFNSQWHKHCSLICYFHFCYGCITILVIKRNLFSMRKIAERMTKKTAICLSEFVQALIKCDSIWFEYHISLVTERSDDTMPVICYHITISGSQDFCQVVLFVICQQESIRPVFPAAGNR